MRLYFFKGDRPLLPVRGGYWADQSAAGVFALGFSAGLLWAAGGVGFRAALSLCQILKPYGVLISCQGIKGFAPVPQGKKNRMFVDAASISCIGEESS